jgi:hypothetical protein
MDLPDVVEEDNSEMRKIGKQPMPGRDADGPSDLSGGPGGPGGPDDSGARRGPGGPGGRRPGGPGGPGGDGPRAGGPGRGEGGPGGGEGGPGGGGAPNIAQIVSRSMERNDTDGDGVLSAAEISAIDGQFRDAVVSADSDGDGQVTRAELTAGMAKRISERRGQQ